MSEIKIFRITGTYYKKYKKYLFRKEIRALKKEDAIESTGVVVESVKGGFRVRLDDTDHVILATLGGKLRKHYIRIVNGDKVKVHMSPYDLTKGRIVYRFK